MRTTLTLDDDVAAKLKRLSERQKSSFKDTVNAVLRRGLSAQDCREPRAKGVSVQTFRSALLRGVDPLRLNQLVDDLAVEEAVVKLSADVGEYHPPRRQPPHLRPQRSHRAAPARPRLVGRAPRA